MEEVGRGVVGSGQCTRWNDGYTLSFFGWNALKHQAVGSCFVSWGVSPEKAKQCGQDDLLLLLFICSSFSSCIIFRCFLQFFWCSINYYEDKDEEAVSLKYVVRIKLGSNVDQQEEKQKKKKILSDKNIFVVHLKQNYIVNNSC